MSGESAARILSVVGHPALVMPVAVVLAAADRDAATSTLWVAVVASILVVAVVLVYSVVQVRAGRWTHIDASVPRERSQLNLFLTMLLSSMSVLLWWSGQPTPLVAGMGVASALVAFAHLVRTWLKVSLHASFAVFAGSLFWPDSIAVVLTLCLAAAISWSRLALRRHTPAEVCAGLLLGGTAGIAVNLLAR